jgi:mono/diheme cytochrome c family protein
VNLRTAFLTASVFALAAACTPAANEPAPATPEAAPIAEVTAPSGPAAENTTDSLSTTPAADPAAAPAPAAPASAAAASGPTTAELTAGRATYAASCAMCHGPTGQGTQMGVALTNGLEVPVIKEKVTKGMVNPGDKMPPMGAALSADQLDALAKFVAAGLPA